MWDVGQGVFFPFCLPDAAFDILHSFEWSCAHALGLQGYFDLMKQQRASGEANENQLLNCRKRFKQVLEYQVCQTPA